VVAVSFAPELGREDIDAILMAKGGVSTYEVEEDAASGAPPAAVGEHHAPAASIS